MGVEVALAAGVAGAALSAVGSYKQGQAAQGAANYNAAIAEQNAKLAKQAAIENERRQRVILRSEQESVRANLAAGGRTAESVYDILQVNAMNAELEALTFRHQGELEVRGYQTQAELYNAEAANAGMAGLLGGAAGLLNSGFNIAMKRA